MRFTHLYGFQSAQLQPDGFLTNKYLRVDNVCADEEQPALERHRRCTAVAFETHTCDELKLGLLIAVSDRCQACASISNCLWDHDWAQHKIARAAPVCCATHMLNAVSCHHT